MTASAPGPSDPVGLTETRRVTEQESIEIAALTAAATKTDGVGPLDDQVRTELAYGAGPGSRHILGRAGGSPAVVAYSHATQDGDGVSAHVVVDPAYRRRGAGGALVDHLLELRGGDPSGGPVRVWAHGDTDAARALAAKRGFARVRDLWQMRRPLAQALPLASYPEGVTVRTFEPGRDEEAWVRLNATAFAAHPEQGRLTVDDLRHRMDERWFDARGFFLAEREGELVGSHWTKVHSSEETGGDPVGEVYAVGVHPDAQGLGLGKALTLTGLHHLAGLDLPAVMLYVDGDNAAAVGLYERLGFSTTTVDAMYAKA